MRTAEGIEPNPALHLTPPSGSGRIAHPVMAVQVSFMFGHGGFRSVEHFRYEFHTGCEAEIIDLWLDGPRGRIEVAYAAMGIPGLCYRLTCVHQPLSAGFGILEVERAEARAAEGEFTPVELDEEQMPLPLVIEYLRVLPSPVFVHGASSLAFTGTVTPEFSLMLAVYDLDGRPEDGPLREIYDHLDKKKLAAQAAEPGAAPDTAIGFGTHRSSDGGGAGELYVRQHERS